jgi:hypothetical protein
VLIINPQNFIQTFDITLCLRLLKWKIKSNIKIIERGNTIVTFVSVCGDIPHCNHRRCGDKNENLICVWCDGEILDHKYWTAYAGYLDERKSCQSEYFISLSIKTKWIVIYQIKWKKYHTVGTLTKSESVRRVFFVITNPTLVNTTTTVRGKHS